MATRLTAPEKAAAAAFVGEIHPVHAAPMAAASRSSGNVILQNNGRLLPGRENLIEVRAFTISGDTKAVLYEHPPYERLPFRTTITPANHEFSLDVAMQPAVYDGSMPICGDGVEFRLEIRDGSRTDSAIVRPLYRSQTQSGRAPLDSRVGRSERVQGQTVELLFTTTAGPKGDTCAAWAGWGDPHFNGDLAAQPVFRQVYDHEIKIYEYPDYLPRAALFSNAEVAQDDQSALARLAVSVARYISTAVVSSTESGHGGFGSYSETQQPAARAGARRQNCVLHLAGSEDRRRRRAIRLVDAERQRLSGLEGIRRWTPIALDHGKLFVSWHPAAAGQASGTFRL